MGLALTGTPITISEFASPCPTPQVFVPSDAPVPISSVTPRFGLVNYYTNQLRGSLALRMTFTTQTALTCGATPGDALTVDNSAATPMPVYYNGEFRMSPGITADGHVRFGVLTVDDSATPQTSSFAYVRACTGQTTCDPVRFPARLKFKKLTAEVLLGDSVPGSKTRARPAPVIESDVCDLGLLAPAAGPVQEQLDGGGASLDRDTQRCLLPLGHLVLLGPSLRDVRDDATLDSHY
jgi:hypothetical protein